MAINRSNSTVELPLNLASFSCNALTPWRTSKDENLEKLTTLSGTDMQTLTLAAQSVTTFTGTAQHQVPVLIPHTPQPDIRHGGTFEAESHLLNGARILRVPAARVPVMVNEKPNNGKLRILPNLE